MLFLNANFVEQKLKRLPTHIEDSNEECVNQCNKNTNIFCMKHENCVINYL